jgi:hypothetical protein
MKTQLNVLKLVYPPISNQEAEWLKDDADVRDMLKISHLYMIGQRDEAFFDFNKEQLENEFKDTFITTFIYRSGSNRSEVTLNVIKILEHNDFDIENDLDKVMVEFGEKFVRIWEVDPNTEERLDVIAWFTTEKILQDRWNGYPGIEGFDNYRDFTKYHLHYIGISKQEDSLTRLVVKPHDKRLRILSYENTFTEQSRLTDEIVLFFFKVDSLRSSIIETEEDINEMINGVTFDQIKIVADAEKAYIKIIDSKYNTVKYPNYPKGTDGLYDSGLYRYGYALGEDITFVTDHAEIHGKYAGENSFFSNADLILIEDDKVSLLKF